MITNMNNIDEITITFPVEKENITWEKRQPHTINSANYSENKETKEKINLSKTNVITNNKPIEKERDPNDLKKDIHIIRRFVFNRENEYNDAISKFDKTKILEQLKNLLEIINENKVYYKDEKVVKDAIQRIKKLKGKIERSLNPKTIKQPSKNGKTQKGLEIEKALNEIKQQLKNRYISETERIKIYDRLLKLKNEIEVNKQMFTGIDNIPVRQNQIEQYIIKLNRG